MPEITPPDGPGQHAAWIRQIEQRLARLERADRLSNAAFAGRLRLLDTDGNDRVIIGELTDGAYGQEIYDGDGNTVLRVDEGGMRRPALNLPYRAAQDPVDVTTDAVWLTVTWETAVASRTHPAIRWTSAISADAATTGEARLIINNSETSGVHAIPASTAERYTWSWAPTNWVLGIGGFYLVQLQIRRTSGTGALHSYAPDELLLGTVEDLGATADGL